MRSHLAVTAAVLLGAAGCSGANFPPTYAVTGVVKYQGKPVEGATVILVPGDAAVRSASGVTDAEGNFSVTTYFDAAHQPGGAMSGRYTVTVVKTAQASNAASPQEAATGGRQGGMPSVAESPGEMSPQEAMEAFKKNGPPKSLLPKAYGNPATSDLKVTIDGASPAPLDLELKG